MTPSLFPGSTWNSRILDEDWRPPMTRFDRLRDETAATFRLAVPVAAVQLGMMLMGVVDTMMLGHLSAVALAAGALAHLVTFCALVLGQGILAALDPLV